MSTHLQRILSVAAIALCLGALETQGQDVVRTGLNQEMLAKAIDPGDLKIVMDNVLNTAVLGELKHESIMYKNTDALLKGIAKQEIDLFAMLAKEYYLALISKQDVEPALVLSQNGKTTSQYLLLANRKDAGKKLADFKGKNLIVDARGAEELVETWLDLALNQAGLPFSEGYFSITHVKKPSKAATPVFFGKADLCVLRKNSWDTIIELNPQMQKRLVVIAVSPDLVTGLLAVRKSMNPKTKSKVLNSLMNLKNSPAGSQIMKFARLENIVPPDPKDLNLTLKLVSHREMLVAKAAGAVAAPIASGAGTTKRPVPTGSEPAVVQKPRGSKIE